MNTINYKVLDLATNTKYINSYLEMKNLDGSFTHTEDWFRYKYMKSPYGQAIFVVCLDREKVVGALAFGIYKFVFNSVITKGAISYEVLVHPNHRGKGIFSRLIEIGEEEAIKRQCEFMLNFPNYKSIRGFLNAGWKKLNYAQYWIHSLKPLNCIYHASHFNKLFIPVKPQSTIEQIQCDIPFGHIEPHYAYSNGTLKDRNFLKYRFIDNAYGTYEYHCIDNVMFVLRPGLRGKIKEIQVLTIIADKKINKNYLKELIKKLKNENKYDIVSLPLSKNHPLRLLLPKLCFIKVPTSTNVTCKNLNQNKVDISDLVFDGADYHTY